MHDRSVEREADHWALNRLYPGQLELAGQVGGHPRRAISAGSRVLGGCDRWRHAAPDNLAWGAVGKRHFMKNVAQGQTCNEHWSLSLCLRLLTGVAGPACFLVPNNRGQGCG